MGRGLSLLMRWMPGATSSMRCPHCIPCRKCSPAGAAARGARQLARFQMQHVNPVQQETKIPSGRNRSSQKWGERKGTQNCRQTSKHISNPPLEETSLEIPRVLGTRVPRDSLGSALLLSPSASRQHGHISRCLLSGAGRSRSLDGTAACAERRWSCTAGDPFLSLVQGFRGGLFAVMAIGTHGRDRAAELIKAIP